MDHKGRLSAIHLLSVEKAKAELHTLDTEFTRYHMDIIELLDDECEAEREEAAIEEHEIRVAHIFVCLESIYSYRIAGIFQGG